MVCLTRRIKCQVRFLTHTHSKLMFCSNTNNQTNQCTPRPPPPPPPVAVAHRILLKLWGVVHVIGNGGGTGIRERDEVWRASALGNTPTRIWCRCQPTSTTVASTQHRQQRSRRQQRRQRHEAADAATANNATLLPLTSQFERGRRRIIGSSGSNIGECLPKKVMEESDRLTRAVLSRAQSLSN